MQARVRFAAIVFTFLGATSLLQADWSGVASTATVDEGDLGKVLLNNDGSVTIRPTISSTSAKIRFNVTPSPGIEPPPPGSISGGLLFTMRALDNGVGARVIATLKRVTLDGFYRTLAQRTDVLAIIDSDLAPANASWQTVWSQQVYDRTVFTGGLTFLSYGYVVEVQLIKHDSTGTPGIMGVQLIRDET
jgi:hypothetical protein